MNKQIHMHIYILKHSNILAYIHSITFTCVYSCIQYILKHKLYKHTHIYRYTYTHTDIDRLMSRLKRH